MVEPRRAPKVPGSAVTTSMVKFAPDAHNNSRGSWAAQPGKQMPPAEGNPALQWSHGWGSLPLCLDGLRLLVAGAGPVATPSCSP